MDADIVKAKLDAAKQKLGREIRVFETSTASTKPKEVPDIEEPDDYYDFTAEDYFRVMATKKEGFKTRKTRDAEEAARRSRFTKAVIRVRFPDNCTLEATFHPSEKIQSLFDLLDKVVVHPELPFIIYTTPPKKQITNTSQDLYSAGFVPGAIVYFSRDLPKDGFGRYADLPFLQDEVMSLKGLELSPEPVEEPEQSAPEPVIADSSNVQPLPERKPVDKKSVKPKWLKM